ncbi:MAG: deoxyribonuclease V [Candidatus Coatesbacteria bacterium]|nr:MAG: deoxyribonuclease V [Candidatus Coatesbacteria bacterium]
MRGRRIGSAFEAPGDYITGEWPTDYKSAAVIQRKLAVRVIKDGPPEPVSVVAGADVSYSKKLGLAVAVVVLCRAGDTQTLAEDSAAQPTIFPYIPGLLSFREAPVILEALERFAGEFDLLLVDGHGVAHPRRLGLASHLGVLLDVPTVGCAKSRLVGEYEEPLRERGARMPLADSGERIGTVLRTRTGVKPVFVSVGHRVSLDYAEEIILATAAPYRLPEPLRRAHNLVTRLRKGMEESING